ncbi:N-acetylglucosamine-1-phosphodiester alpha-N-acetylglucosaminidase-like isoform X3 [Nerophis ophidion]|uniref:N-acetylglucosamine-1-phosphodiester alpha-N-acetylglucosaminidase-like isoform X3 n=1 Tax=Nerophis ophidion TaxID=159077 RepID=UPI002AE05EB0|nr:N-acetylglucosamine-1-phosphodiester alpha-N-acetylglucosaminidase-like isoform X3 [Nerophis ophidion]
MKDLFVCFLLFAPSRPSVAEEVREWRLTDVLAAYSQGHGPQHSHRYVRDCQPVVHGNTTHETWTSNKDPLLPVAESYVFVSHLQDRVVSGHFTVVKDPLRTVSVLEPGRPGGCDRHTFASVEKSSRDGRCLYAQNAGFFNTHTGECLGNVVSDGRLVKNSGGVQNAQFGIRRDGTLVFGVSLWEMADLMKEKGVINAINLDGGGSSTFVSNGSLASYPSDDCKEDKRWRCARRVSTILCVHPRRCQLADCGAHGVCANGTCVCEAGWRGHNCSQATDDTSLKMEDNIYLTEPSWLTICIILSTLLLLSLMLQVLWACRSRLCTPEHGDYAYLPLTTNAGTSSVAMEESRKDLIEDSLSLELT